MKSKKEIDTPRLRRSSVSNLFLIAAIALLFVYSLLFGGLAIQATPAHAAFGQSGVSEADSKKHDSTITIGFIGDSLTYGAQAIDPATDAAPLKATSYLGSRFTAINRGINGQTTANWANNSCSKGSSACLTDAISAFQQANVEVVHIMLGTNDVTISRRVSSVTYYNNLQRIIDQLKTAGFKRVILARPIYFGVQYNTNRDQQSLNTLASDYHQALRALVVTNHGFVLMGDTQAYEWFKNHYDFTGTAGAYYDDPTHPTSLGYDKLGEFWAEALKAALFTKPASTQTLLQSSFYLY